MLNNLFIFAAALFLVIQGASVATRYSALLAKSFRLSKYTIGFIVIAIISILPETFIAINSSLEGVPSFGLGVLLGSNVADMTLVIGIIILFARRGIKIENKTLKNNRVFPLLLLVPVILGLDGYFSRIDGAVLIVMGAILYYVALQNGVGHSLEPQDKKGRFKNLVLLLGGMAAILVGAHFTVTSATEMAHMLGLSPVIIGILVVGLGATMPELFFALRAVKKRDDALAVGDILGTVLADATIVVGVLALMSPFSFPRTTIYITGLFMVGASVLLLQFMHSGRIIGKKEGYLLIAYWIMFICVEFMAYL